MIDFDLLRPELAWVPLSALVVLAFGLRGLVASRHELLALVDGRQLARFLPEGSRARRLARLVLACGGLALLGLAAIGPVRGYTFREVKRTGLDLVVCLDTSRSMLAEDLRPNRLERAKREVVGLLERMKDDRCAVIAFSGDAREVAPLTHDRSTLRALLSYVVPEDNRRGGTDLAAALSSGLAMFDGRTGAHEAVVLLTDGEDLEGRALSIADEAAGRGIRVYVVGVGTEGGGKIPIQEPDGHSAFLRGPDGEEVVSRLDAASLRAIAERTGGDYLSVEQSPTPLEELYAKRISRLEGRESAEGTRRVPHDRYQWPLVLALACMLLECGLRERRSRAPGSRGRTGVRSGPRFAALLGLAAAFGPQAPAGDALPEVVRLHAEGRLEEALAAVEEALGKAGEDGASEHRRAELHYARGVVVAGLQDPARRLEAAPSFASARALAGPGELRLDATYDAALVQLLEAERLRGELVAPSPPTPAPGAPGTGTLPGLSAAPPATGAPDEDPIETARAAYRAARSGFLERLRADWSDPDTRANLELIQRRMRELDELERQREEEQPQDPDSEQPGDPSSEGQESEDPQDPQQQEPSQDGASGERPDEPPDGEPPPPEPDAGQEPPEESEGQPPEPQEGAGEEPRPEPADEAAPAGEPEERLLTREEVQRLLDRLADIEQEARALREALRAARRVPVPRDW